MNYLQNQLEQNFNNNSNLNNTPCWNNFNNYTILSSNNYGIPQNQVNNSNNWSFNNNPISNNINDVYGIQNYNKQLQEIRDSFLKFYK